MYNVIYIDIPRHLHGLQPKKHKGKLTNVGEVEITQGRIISWAMYFNNPTYFCYFQNPKTLTSFSPNHLYFIKNIYIHIYITFPLYSPKNCFSWGIYFYSFLFDSIEFFFSDIQFYSWSIIMVCVWSTVFNCSSGWTYP